MSVNIIIYSLYCQLIFNTNIHKLINYKCYSSIAYCNILFDISKQYHSIQKIILVITKTQDM